MIETKPSRKEMYCALNEAFEELLKPYDYTSSDLSAHDPISNIVWLLRRCYLYKVPYFDGCEVPRSHGTRKTYYQISLNTQALEFLYDVYLKLKFNIGYRQLPLRNGTIPLFDRWSPCGDQSYRVVENAINEHLKDGFKRDYSGIGAILYSFFAETDEPVRNFLEARKRIELDDAKAARSKTVEPPETKKKPWWKLWRKKDVN